MCSMRCLRSRPQQGPGPLRSRESLRAEFRREPYERREPSVRWYELADAQQATMRARSDRRVVAGDCLGQLYNGKIYHGYNAAHMVSAPSRTPLRHRTSEGFPRDRQHIEHVLARNRTCRSNTCF